MVDALDDITASPENRDRRSEKDRRLLCHDIHRPDRRRGNDRRKGTDRRKRKLSSAKRNDTVKKK